MYGRSGNCRLHGDTKGLRVRLFRPESSAQGKAAETRSDRWIDMTLPTHGAGFARRLTRMSS